MEETSIETAIYPVLYLIGFAALHSLLASLPVKRAARMRFGPRVDPWYAVFFSASAVVTVLPLAALLYTFPGRVLYVLPSPWFWLFVSAQLLVGIISLRAFLDAPHRFLIRAQLAGPASPTSPDSFALAIRGIYCHIRDPFLLSGFLLIWLTPFMTENLLLVYLITTVYLFLGSLHWEKRLTAQFGSAYLAYKNEVPRMIPRGNSRWSECAGDGSRRKEQKNKKL
ncbi:MAG TPA: isoprenylcysteine carboxylmethyltransferase family protein [Methanothrix sp.]|nr:isoprenylcysteine carboxylmethyltransferase family protein [Methanothrix sp.]